MPRPLSVTLLALAVLSLAVFNLLGTVTSLERYAFLSRLPLTAPLAYLVATHVIWATAFGALSVGLWRLKHWGRIGTLAASLLYIGQLWINRWLFDQTDFARATGPYALTATLISLLVVWMILGRRQTQRSFSA